MQTILIALSDENEREFASKYIGKNIKVLWETEEEGHTSNYIKVVDKSKKQIPDKMDDVLIAGFENDYLYI